MLVAAVFAVAGVVLAVEEEDGGRYLQSVLFDEELIVAGASASSLCSNDSTDSKFYWRLSAERR